jgi:hypothetical protein
MKIVYLLLLVTPFFLFSSCKDKNTEGCTDPKALNYNSDAKINTECTYSSVVFYASGETYNGAEITQIQITLATIVDTVGVLTSFGQGYPNSCDAAGTVSTTLKAGGEQGWIARYFLVAGGTETNQGFITPSNSVDCIRVDVMP